MTQRDWALWLPPALLLLWLPGSMALRGPKTVAGTEGGSLDVCCRYGEKFKGHSKYWCRAPHIRPCRKLVMTAGDEREVRSGRVSIRDEPAQLSFTVTLSNLTADDQGAYWCGIDVTLWKDGRVLDPTFQVVVSVSPAPTSSIPVSATFTMTSTPTTEGLPLSSTPLPTETVTPSQSSLDNPSQSQPPGLLVLLTLGALLLLLLAGTCLVAWRMRARRRKAAQGTQLSRNHSLPQLDEPREACYANLELQTWPSGTAPEQQRDTEVEYSTVAAPRDEVDYTSVTFALPSQDSEATSTALERPRDEPEYSVVKKTAPTSGLPI